MSQLAAYITRPSTVLRISGDDHAEFLQSQGSADLRIPAGSCRFSLWLDHKGLIHGDSFVLKISDEEVILVSYKASAQDLVAKFDRHIIADDVEILDETDQWKLVSLPAASSELIQADSEMQMSGLYSIGGGFAFAGRQLGTDSWELLVGVDEPLPFAFEEMTHEEAEAIRIGSGIPLFPSDLAAGEFNPLEANLLSALSFDKGCYLGQEVVARVHRLGRVSRRLVSLKATSP